jgi:hypothetical protein
MLHDYTNNGNDAEVSWSVTRPIVTDRGQYFDKASYIDFPTNIYKQYPSKSTMIIVMWVLALDDGYLITVKPSYNEIYLYWMKYNSSIMIKFQKSESTQYTTSISFSNIYLDQWNLLVFHLEQGLGSTTAYVYEASGTITQICSKTYSSASINLTTTTWSINKSAEDAMDLFIYEIWWLDTVVTDIQNTISSLNITRPSTLISTISSDPFKTYDAYACSSVCTTQNFSCNGIGGTCINVCGNTCTCGCYGLSSTICLDCNSVNCINYLPNNCTICRTGYYLNTSSGTCIKCPSYCSSCTSNTLCTGCISGYAITQVVSNTLCNVCPTGQYSSNSTCFVCPDLCTACTSNSVCTSCKSNANLVSLNQMCYCNSGYTYHTGGFCVSGFGASAYMDSNSTIILTFSQPLNAELDATLLSFKDGSIVYGSSTFILSIATSKETYHITLKKILLSGLNTMRLYFPTTPNTIISISNSDLPTQDIVIIIIASSITTSCSSIPNCSTCSSTGSSFVCDSCINSECLYTDPSIRCGTCCDNGYYLSTKLCIKCAAQCYTCNDGSTCSLS